MTSAVVVSEVTLNTTKSSMPQFPLVTLTTNSRLRRLLTVAEPADAPTVN